MEHNLRITLKGSQIVLERSCGHAKRESKRRGLGWINKLGNISRQVVFESTGIYDYHRRLNIQRPKNWTQADTLGNPDMWRLCTERGVGSR